MKSFAAILVGPIQYIEIPLGTAFFFNDCWNVINDDMQQLFVKKHVNMINRDSCRKAFFFADYYNVMNAQKETELCAPIVSKESCQSNFLGSHIVRPNVN